MKVFIDLVYLDTKTLFSFFFWCNLLLALIAAGYWLFYKDTRQSVLIIKIFFAKILQAIVWVFIVNRGNIPDWVSINTANILFFIGMYLETDVIQRLIPVRNRVIMIINFSMLIFMIIGFNILTLFKVSFNIRNQFLSFSISILFIICGMNCILIKSSSKIKLMIGLLHLVFAIMFIVRGVYSIFLTSLDVFTSFPWYTVNAIGYGTILIIDAVGVQLLINEEKDELLWQSRQMYRMVSDSSYDWEYLTDRDMNIRYISPSCERITGYSVKEFEDNPDLIRQIIVPEYIDDITAQHFQKHPTDNRCLDDEIEFPIRTVSGTIRWIGHTCRSVFDSHGRYLGRRVSNRDITNIKQLEFELRNEVNLKNEAIKMLKKQEKELIELTTDLHAENKQLSNAVLFDPLTGINSRLYFNKRIDEEIELAERYNFNLSMIFFDLDHFKKVNDSFGHDVGDEVLKSTAGTVRSLIRWSDIFARWGGEEFVILMPQTRIIHAISIAEKIRIIISRVKQPVVGNITISIGVAERFPKEHTKSWFKRIDKALYEAKNRGRNNVRVCSTMREGFSMLKRVGWEKNWNSGNNVIDTQHIELTELSNQLVDLFLKYKNIKKLKPTLYILYNKLMEHFDSEERELRKINCPLLESHKNEHNELRKKLYKLPDILNNINYETSVQVIQKLIDDMIYKHLLLEDTKFFIYFKYTDNSFLYNPKS